VTPEAIALLGGIPRSFIRFAASPLRHLSSATHRATDNPDLPLLLSTVLSLPCKLTSPLASATRPLDH